MLVDSHPARRGEGEAIAERCGQERRQGRLSYSCQGGHPSEEVRQQNSLRKSATQVR